MHARSNPQKAAGLLKAGAAACWIMLALIPVQIVIFTAWPPPAAVTDWFTLFQENWLLGLLSLDLLYLVNNTLLIFIYLGLYAALKRVSESAMLAALVFGLIGITVYYPSNTAFEMLTLSNQYAAAATEAQRWSLIAAGEGMLAIYTGTAFNVYYILNAVVLFIVSAVMLRSAVFNRATAYVGLLSGVLMSIPSSAGTLGMIFALASLVPWIFFLALVARRLIRIYHQEPVSS